MIRPAVNGASSVFYLIALFSNIPDYLFLDTSRKILGWQVKSLQNYTFATLFGYTHRCLQGWLPVFACSNPQKCA